jgi:hypothetical protein
MNKVSAEIFSELDILVSELPMSLNKITTNIEYEGNWCIYVDVEFYNHDTDEEKTISSYHDIENATPETIARDIFIDLKQHFEPYILERKLGE